MAVGLPSNPKRIRLVASAEQSIKRVQEIGDFTTNRALPDDCKVVSFEVGHDSDLHVNVTHRQATAAVKGWAGPGNVPDGFIYNRTFGDTPQAGMVRHIRDMVFAARM